VVLNFRLIVDKIDKDADGFVSREELKDWIQYTQKRYIVDDVERQWKAHNPENKEKISWDEYKKMVYGFMDGKNTVISGDKIFSSSTLGVYWCCRR
jgi:Ca2+-binding EF-hand superfamily protein